VQSQEEIGQERNRTNRVDDQDHIALVIIREDDHPNNVDERKRRQRQDE